MKNSLPFHLIIKRVLPISNNFTFSLLFFFLVWIGFFFISMLRIYWQSFFQLIKMKFKLILTNPGFFPLFDRTNKKIKLRASSCTVYGFLNRTNYVEPKAFSLLYKENGRCKNPQKIMSFKPHVAFSHIVSNEVLS